jgi:hypothetical protein
MGSLFKSLLTLLSFEPVSAQDGDERYLAESVDMQDLERRMRQIDSGRAGQYAIGSCGDFTH